MSKEKAGKTKDLEVENARKALSRQRALDAMIEDDDAELGLSGFDFSADDLEEAVEFDIFDYCENEYVKKGDFVEYTIKKNGATVGFKKHPYSWEKIQREFGGGRYNILAKSTTTGRIVKRQTCAVEDALTDERKESSNGFDPSELVSRIAEVVKPKETGPNFMELFTLMQAQQEKAREEADRASERAKREAETQTATLVQMMQQNTMMMLELFKSQQPKTDPTLEITRLMQSYTEKFDSRLERVLDKISTQDKKQEFGLLEVLKLQQDAQDKGFKLYSQLNQIAEAKAEEKIELIEELRESGGSGSGEKKSMTDTLIETMLPTIATALAKSGEASQAPQQVRALPPQRIPSQQQIARHPQPINANAARPGIRPVQAQAVNQRNIQPIQKESAPARIVSGPVVGQSNQSNSLGGLPKVNLSTIEIKKGEDEVELKTFRDKATQVIVPVLAEHLVAKTDAAIASGIAHQALTNNGIDRKEFLVKFPCSAILDLLKGFGLEAESLEWVKTVYANLETRSDT